MGEWGKWGMRGEVCNAWTVLEGCGRTREDPSRTIFSPGGCHLFSAISKTSSAKLNWLQRGHVQLLQSPAQLHAVV